MRVVVHFRWPNGREEVKRLQPGYAIDVFDRMERLRGRVLVVEAPGREFWTVKRARREFARRVGENHSVPRT